MSGFEIVGVLLGVLPICIEAWKNPKGPVSTLHKIFSRKKHRKALEEFYQEFLIQTYLFKRSIKCVIDNLNIPASSGIRIQDLIDSIDMAGDPTVWKEDSVVFEAMAVFFDGSIERDIVVEILKKVLDLFGRLLDDKSVKLLDCHKNQLQMYEELQRFQEKGSYGIKSASVKEKKDFFSGEDTRATYLLKLKKWNKTLTGIINQACLDRERAAAKTVGYNTSSSTLILPQTTAMATGTQSRTGTFPLASTAKIRNLSKRLFTALSNRWTCNCEAPHEAQFCLAGCTACCGDSSTTNFTLKGKSNHNHTRYSTNLAGADRPEVVMLSFDFMLKLSQSSAAVWCEGTVKIVQVESSAKTASPLGSSTKRNLEMICEDFKELSISQTGHVGLQVVVQDYGNANQLVWTQPQARRAKQNLQQQLPSISLDAYLQASSSPPSLPERRKLALLFAKSLFQLHDSPWADSFWDKKRIQFFQIAEGPSKRGLHFDLEHPYLSTDFESLKESPEDRRSSVLHKSPGVLRLAILFIEIHMWKRIEELYTPDAMGNDGNPNSNTNLFTAFRVLKEILANECDPGYCELIQDCLEMRWFTGTQICSGSHIEDSEEDVLIWDGVRENIIVPLQQEIELGA